MLRNVNFGILYTRNGNVNSAHKKAGAVGSTPAYRLEIMTIYSLDIVIEWMVRIFLNTLLIGIRTEVSNSYCIKIINNLFSSLLPYWPGNTLFCPITCLGITYTTN